ncbi:MAG: hypothetical protein NC191_00605 [Muribaculaceae bacterium]|nr:hypothetical protein [Muribaculaceae bacterium]
MIKKSILIAILLLAISGTIRTFANNDNSSPVLKGAVMAVPNDMYGLWRVSSKLIDTDSPVKFKEKSLDLWNLSTENNVINLSNPFSGASARVEINEVDGNTVTFTKCGTSGNKKLTDTVKITISSESFEGTNKLKLDTISEVNGNIIKTETATYSLKGERIAGESILND